ncbi:hypothetical protein P3T18_002981 [Paraburkholderia sp. GAS199]|uniref:TniQ family protein n=1 Tax=Paraburkholderia sp. GAS199 TaxID=3035126 RepID=UPI003D24EBB3
MRPITPSNNLHLVEPIGVGTGLVEASSSVWKRAAERASVRFGDMVRWAFEQRAVLPDYPHEVSGSLALKRRLLGVDGNTAVARVYLDPLRPLVESDYLEACTLLPFAGMLTEKNILRRYKAWCPLCLMAMKERSGVYEPLLWRLTDVTVCPEHNVNLVTECESCNRPGEIVARFARVGCCSRCGAWQGNDESPGLRSGDDLEVRIARAVAGLLSRTNEFREIEHDGRLTFRRMLTSDEMTYLLASALDMNVDQVRLSVARPRLPRLRALAMIADNAQAPLDRVILGQLRPWRKVVKPASEGPRPTPRPDWTVIAVKFRQMADDVNVTRLKDACATVGISLGSARIRFPDHVKRIVERGRRSRKEEAEQSKTARMEKLRNAFRVLVAKGLYPSTPRLTATSGVSQRWQESEVRQLIDEEWARLGEGQFFRRRRTAGTRKLFVE